MKSSRLAGFGVTFLLAAAALSAPASGKAAQLTIHGTLVLSAPSANPCTGGLGSLVFSSKYVVHVTANAAGGLAFTGTFVGTFTFTGVNSMDSASGRATGWFGGTVSHGGVTQLGGTFSISVVDGWGNHITGGGVFHITRGPDGTVRAFVLRLRLHCN